MLTNKNNVSKIRLPNSLISRSLNNKSVPPRHILQHCDMLKHLITKAVAIRKTHQHFQRLLPKEIRPHCKVMNITDDTLILQANSAICATRLRYLSSHLLKKLKIYDNCKNISDIHCHVRPCYNNELPVTSRFTKPQVKFSPETAQMIREIGSNIKHPKLKAALLSLGNSSRF